jgi:hypothetical protein
MRLHTARTNDAVCTAAGYTQQQQQYASTLQQAVRLTGMPPKLFMDMTVTVQSPKVAVAPSLVPALAEVARAAQAMWPAALEQDATPLLLSRRRRHSVAPEGATAASETAKAETSGQQRLMWWDTLRGLVHGRVDITVRTLQRLCRVLLCHVV